MIKRLSENLTEDLCAQQVITSLPDCIKELIDNAIDAKSSQIRVYLDDYGKKSIIVADNGTGIENFDCLGKKGSTSKNKENIETFKTLGFRGQALHSIAKVSQAMKITSKHSSKQSIEFDLKTLKLKNSEVERSEGTTVKIDYLFQLLPVRRFQLGSKYRESLKKVDEMIRQYSLIFPSISFILINKRDGKDDILIETTKLSNTISNWKQRIDEILGTKIANDLTYAYTDHVEGWMLKNIESGSGRENNYIRKNMHYMYVNRRPVDPLPKILEALDSVYKKYSRSSRYVFVLNLKVSQKELDVNLTPNKRQIFIPIDTMSELIKQITKFMSENLIENVPKLEQFHRRIEIKEVEKQKKKEERSQKSEKSSKKGGEVQQKIRSANLLASLNERMSRGKSMSLFNKNNKKNDEKQEIKQTKPTNKPTFSEQVFTHKRQEIQKEGSKIEIELQEKIKIEEEIPLPVHKKIQSQIQKPIQKKPVIQSQPRKESLIIGKEEQRKIQELVPKSLTKQHFNQFKVLGQFNRGFILSQFCQHFYLVDQHAASEKFHFQKLMNSSFNKMQPNDRIALDPIQIDSLEQHGEELQEDGFEFVQLQNNQIILTKAPIVFGKSFGKKYFLELLDKKMRLRQHDEFYQAAASKACRTAVMVGDVLQTKEMESIVKELSKLQSPWNCPHGRPTLIDLGANNLSSIKKKKKYVL